jgi:hypothetical protein
MTAIQVVYWRDIPAQVKARSGRARAAKPLADRFQESIDAAAMRAGASQSDAYLAEWRTVDRGERECDPASLVEALVAELESAYPSERLQALVDRGGRA